MQLKSFHNAKPDEGLSLTRITESLITQGLSPVIGPARSSIARSLESFGVQGPQVPADLEALLSPSGQNACLLRLRSAHSSQNGNGAKGLDALLISLDAAGDFEPFVRKHLGITLEEGSLEEARKIETLSKTFSEAGSNEKLESRQEISAAAEHLTEDKLRAQLKEIFGTFGNRYVDRKEVIRLPSIEKDSESLDGFVQRGMLIEHFQVTCPSCDRRYLAFADRSRADSAAKNSDGCASCDCRLLTTTSTLGVAENYSKALQQEFWLEALARDTAKRWTKFVWAGQKVGPSNMDVLAVFADKTVLIECKDGSFGLNDLDTTAGKASRVNADVVIAISTHDFHPNVTDALRQSPNHERVFLPVSSSSATQIQQYLDDVFSRMARQHAKSWFSNRSFTWNLEELGVNH